MLNIKDPRKLTHQMVKYRNKGMAIPKFPVLGGDRKSQKYKESITGKVKHETVET